MAKRKEQEIDDFVVAAEKVGTHVWSAEPKLVFNTVALIAAFRASQAEQAVYRVEGEELAAYVGGTKIAVTQLPTNQRDAKTAKAKAQSILEPVVKKYGAFSESDILKIVATENEFRVLSKDGRKYSIDQRTGKVT